MRILVIAQVGAKIPIKMATGWSLYKVKVIGSMQPCSSKACVFFGGMMEWIKCCDRLPEENQNVLFYVKDRNEMFAGTFGGSFKDEPVEFFENLDCYNFEGEIITHWILLPLPPEE